MKCGRYCTISRQCLEMGRRINRMQENVLIIADTSRQVADALTQASPAARVISVASYFDAIAELSANRYTTVLAAAEPIERRPEAAIRTLREMAGEGRIVLFGHPTLEPLSRKMLSFGIDDYVVTPVNSGELSQIFGAAPLHLTTDKEPAAGEALPASPPSRLALLAGMPLAEIILDTLIQHPQGAPAAAVSAIAARIAPAMQLHYLKIGAEPPPTPQVFDMLTHLIPVNNRHIADL